MNIAMTYLQKFWQEDQGQDLIEYTLLLAFVALASAALFSGAGRHARPDPVRHGHRGSFAAAARRNRRPGGIGFPKSGAGTFSAPRMGNGTCIKGLLEF